jgi:DNA recombination protein RmuC
MATVVAVLVLAAGALAALVAWQQERARSRSLFSLLRAAESDLARERAGREHTAEQLVAAQLQLARQSAELDNERSRARDEARLTEQFEAISSRALATNNEQFLALADTRLKQSEARAAGELENRRLAVEQMIGPLQQALERVEQQLASGERARTDAHAALKREVELVRASSEQLRVETAALVSALRKPQARGQWGERQLRRVVELAGMVERCDFDLQVSVRTAEGLQRPDLVVRLAGGKNIVVDAKVSLAAFLEAAETSDEGVREQRLRAHARSLRDHVDSLASKAYWSAFSPAPEFVVLFVPGDAFLAAAYEHDPGLLEYAFGKRVHIATPTNLISLLRMVAYGWQQAALADNARAVFDLGRELYKRLSAFGGHVERLGRALGSAVGHYNSAVGSLERSVLVSARRLEELSVTDLELPSPSQIDEAVRTISAPELLGSAEATVVSLPRLGPAADDSEAATR